MDTPQTFNPANLPPVLPQKPIDLPSNQPPSSLSMSNNNLFRGDINQRIQNKMQAAKQNIYQRYFGRSFGTGKATTLKNFGGGLLGGALHKGLETTLKAFRRASSGSGKNLSYKDIKHVSNKIANTLKRLPTNKSYDAKEEHIPLKKQRKLIRDFKKDVKAGKISKADLDDTRKIIENIKV